MRPTVEYRNAATRAYFDLKAIENEIADLEADAQSESETRTLAAESLLHARKRLERQQQAIEQIELMLDAAERRDQIQATRPEGCWCFGMGGIGERWVPGKNGAEDALPVRTDYCTCPDGEAARAEDDKIRQVYRLGMRKARLERYFGSTKVPPRYREASFDSYPVSATTEPVVEQLRGYAASCGQPAGKSILLWGEYGIGKTGLAVATMRAAVEEHGADAFFTTVPDLLHEIRSSFGRTQTVRKPYADDDEAPSISADQLQRLVRGTTLLVLDDIGAERATDWVQEALYTLINHRYTNLLRTIFTSNLRPKELAARLGERTAWRIVEMSDVIEVTGPNLRLRKGER